MMPDHILKESRLEPIFSHHWQQLEQILIITWRLLRIGKKKHKNDKFIIKVAFAAFFMRKYQIKTVLKNTSQLVSQLQTLATTGFIQLRQFKQFIFSFFIYL